MTNQNINHHFLLQHQSSSSRKKISFTALPKKADNFKARTVDGTYFAASMELIACLDTPMTLANSSCVMSFMARSTFKLFFIDDRFLRLIDHISEKNDEEY